MRHSQNIPEFTDMLFQKIYLNCKLSAFAFIMYSYTYGTLYVKTFLINY
jgi:hypothetical protein